MALLSRIAPVLEKVIRGGICYAVHFYAKANSKYMEGYDNEEWSYLKYWDANNLCG